MDFVFDGSDIQKTFIIQITAAGQAIAGANAPKCALSDFG